MNGSDNKKIKTCGKAVILAMTALMLASCTTADDMNGNLADRAKLYAAEPFPVRLVDRRKFDRRFMPTEVAAPTADVPGTIIIDTKTRNLYLIGQGGKARRYGIAVGAAGHAWSGTANVGRKAKWPAWYPTDDMKATAPDLPQRIEPGDHNPLGARALYLYADGRDTLYRIHGTSEPWTIGTEASSGCIRMLNEDVIDLYDRVNNGAKVIVR